MDVVSAQYISHLRIAMYFYGRSGAYYKVHVGCWDLLTHPVETSSFNFRPFLK